MADNVNLKVNQTIKGNKFSGNATVRQKFKMRLVVPADIIINVRGRNRNNKKPTLNVNNKNVNLQKPQTNEVKSNDK